jgi:hypothetical protein
VAVNLQGALPQRFVATLRRAPNVLIRLPDGACFYKLREVVLPVTNQPTDLAVDGTLPEEPPLAQKPNRAIQEDRCFPLIQ